MGTIYELMDRASALRGRTQAESISPEDVGGIQYDTLAYIAVMEQDADGLGIRRVYATKAEMEADSAPVGSNGKPLRYGQLVCIYDAGAPEAEDSGDVYAWQKPGWLLTGNIGGIHGMANLLPVMTLDELNAFPASAADVLPYLQGKKPSRYVVADKGYNGGVLDIFSDSMGHVLTEVLTTHFVMGEDGVMGSGGHRDDVVYVYSRSYNARNAPHLDVEMGKWTAWRLIGGDMLLTGLENTVKSLNDVSIKVDALSEMSGPPVMTLTELNAFPAELADVVPYLQGKKPSRYIVTDLGYNAGVLDILSDNSGHVLTEVLTTHLVIGSDGVMGSGGHKDDDIYVYYRSYNRNAPNLETEQGKWTAWKQIGGDLIITVLENLGEKLADVDTRMKTVENSVAGTTARFDGTIADAEMMMASSTASGGKVYYVESKKVFGYYMPPSGTGIMPVKPSLYNNWGGADMFMNSGRSEVLKDKVYLQDDRLYVWSETEGTLVRIKGEGGGSVDALSDGEIDEICV